MTVTVLLVSDGVTAGLLVRQLCRKRVRFCNIQSPWKKLLIVAVLFADRFTC